MFELIRANKRRSALLIAGFVVLLVAGRRGLRRPARRRARRHDHRPRVLRGDGVRLVLEGRRDRPRGQPRQAGRSRSSTSGCTTSSRGCASPAGCPSPRVYIVDDPAPNAFATGRNPKHAAIAVTTGLLEKMNRVELEGVLAHELSHIRNYDILVSTLAVTLVGAVALLTNIAMRMMWWNGGRVRRDGDRRRRQPAGPPRLRAADLRPDHRQGDAGRDQPPARDAGRRQRLPDDPLPAGADLGAREAARRHHGDALCFHCYRTLVDRATDVGRGRRRQVRRA